MPSQKTIDKQIAAWKAEGHTVLLVPFEDGQEVYFKQPNRRELKLIFSKGPKGGPVGMTDAFVVNCYLGGDVSLETLKSDQGTEYLAQLAASIDDLLGTKKAEVKKL
jgi:hypothetical protein